MSSPSAGSMLGLARAGPHAGFKVVITGLAALSALSISGTRSVACSARGSICAIPEHLAGGHRPRPHRFAADRPHVPDVGAGPQRGSAPRTTAATPTRGPVAAGWPTER